MEITISAVIQIAVVAAGVMILKNDLASVKEWIKDLRMTLYGADGRNGVVGDITEIRTTIKSCPQHKDGTHG